MLNKEEKNRRTNALRISFGSLLDLNSNCINTLELDRYSDERSIAEVMRSGCFFGLEMKEVATNNDNRQSINCS